MQQPDNRSARTLPDDGELAEAISDAIADAVMRLPTATRSRILAFLHLMEEPGTTLAELEASRSGVMRLVLTHTGIPAGTRSN
jgi:hypothetical protein